MHHFIIIIIILYVFFLMQFQFNVIVKIKKKSPCEVVWLHWRKQNNTKQWKSEQVSSAYVTEFKGTVFIIIYNEAHNYMASLSVSVNIHTLYFIIIVRSAEERKKL